MTKPCVFAIGLGIGAWTVPLAQRLAARIAHTHYLHIDD